ncbi:MAG: hypothetical protein NZ480_06440 [Bdellovibrionaceae bacterium]|nr:hypothetical protein [Pseudobdellovibrionaceae bacterium]
MSMLLERMFSIALVTTSILVIQITNSYAESIAVPLSGFKQPASDLWDFKSNRYLSPEEVVQIEASTGSSDLIDPAPNLFWSPQVIPTQTEPPILDETETYQFLPKETETIFQYFIGKIQNPKNLQKFRFLISRFNVRDIIAARLLNRLGYVIPSVQYVPKLKIRFANHSELESFIFDFQKALLVDADLRSWISEVDRENNTVTIRYPIVQALPSTEYDFYLGQLLDPQIPEHRTDALRFAQLRAYRALIAPLTLVNIPESINRFHPRAVQVVGGNVIFYHGSASSFFSTTRDDIRWILRKMASLTTAEWQSLVESALLPPSLTQLVTAKIIHRLNQMLEVFQLAHLKISPLPLDLTSEDGLVKNGKVTQELIPDYPFRLSHKDREPIISSDDFKHILRIKGWSAVLQTALNHLNEKLEVLKMEKILKNRQKEIHERIQHHIKTKPWEPLYQKVESWGGSIGGFVIHGDRSLSVGNYQNSKALIQLIDNISVSGSLGYFFAVDGYSYSKPNGLTQIYFSRDYTHIRPLNSIKESKTIDDTVLELPSRLNDLFAILNDQNQKSEETVTQSKSPLKELLQKLRTNETIVITDSLVTAAGLGTVTNFPTLFRLSKTSIANRINLGINGQKLWLRQTFITRTEKGLQISYNYQRNTGASINLDLSYFLNFLSLGWQKNKLNIYSDVYLFDAEKNSDRSSAFELALWDLFKHNQSERLKNQFSDLKFNIHQSSNLSSEDLLFLLWRMRKFDENKKIRVYFPPHAEYPDLKPEEDPVKIHLHRRGYLEGLDYFGLLTQFFNGLLNRHLPDLKAQLPKNTYIDPSQMIWGSSRWKTIRIETDEKTKNSIGILQTVWAGWQASQAQFRQLLEQIHQQFDLSRKWGYPLFQQEEFMTVKKIKFYRIIASFHVLPEAMNNLFEKLFGEDPQFMQKPRYSRVQSFFQSISKTLGKPYHPGEPSFYRRVAMLLGGGDVQKGIAKIQENCPIEHPGHWYNEVFYSCLDEWIIKMFQLLRTYQKLSNIDEKNRWFADILENLFSYFNLDQISEFFDSKHFLFKLQISGFREGDEDGDLDYFSHTYGNPERSIPYLNGFIFELSEETGILPHILDRSYSGF